MQQTNFDEAVDRLVLHDSRYTRDAYLFLRDGLDHTQKLITKNGREKLRHLTGQELCGGLRAYALEQWGPMTATVLGEWGIHACADFGEIVFNLIEGGVFSKTDADRREDFHGCFDFFEAFRLPYLPPAKRAAVSAQPRPAQV